jgi:hypothetical protein
LAWVALLFGFALLALLVAGWVWLFAGGFVFV